MNHLITVIITTYNRKRRVCRAIDSVLEQTYSNTEIIVVDDGSIDDTQEIVRNKYGEKITYFHKKNEGISTARNFGIMRSEGEFISFLDSDDEWLPAKLEKQLAFLEEHSKFDVCYTNEIWIRNGNQVQQGKRHQKYGGRIFKKCIPLCIISPSSVLIKREIFNEIGYFDEDLPVCEDYDFWLRLSASYPIGFLDENLIKKHGGHSDQLSERYPVMDKYRIYSLEKILQGPHLNSEEKKAVMKSIIRRSEIISQGAYKRDRLKMYKNFKNKKERYQRKLRKLQSANT